MSINYKHTLTYSGVLPADEMDRLAMHAANPEINQARLALVAAFKKAGFPHDAVSHVVRPRTVKADK